MLSAELLGGFQFLVLSLSLDHLFSLPVYSKIASRSEVPRTYCVRK